MKQDKVNLRNQRRLKIYGYSIGSFVRTLGKAGFTFPEVRKTVDRILARRKVKILPADTHIRQEMSVGRHNKGILADLSGDEISKLKSMLAGSTT